ncbi:zinc-binding alcohol dehydrogenase family protein [Conexibacter stalactiti]|uniref:Zinc-binding alcohol dehydrogenase family protein n=1 Tax=Conexibacter stalactiti TaxID=1940611 RepID=A0ABU4HZK0_9ACTN|nr:zinc-binding alcohol dehydrogenase family protein [Conexibacter stalactiti]MDW5598720.1 zinc-binding alcohol dehydrogenase family protein [Conexibacter stalactiti]MEC5039362.1 zinc-binding alcohol dehydrogenase family protein [Conexibacter stalactiti]
MRAAVVEQYGTPVAREFDEPTAGEGQVVIAVAAAGVNPVDVARAAGTFYSGRDPLPFVAGGEGVGTLPDGRRVYFDRPVTPFGAIAERALVRSDATIELPDGLDDGLAVALGISGLAAWLPLAWRADLRPGETVLVLGATGVLGLIAVQAAKLLGAGRVVAAGRDAAALERAVAHGADATVRLDGTSGSALTDAFRDAAGGAFDVVIDPLWGAPAAAALGALGRGGRLIQIGQSAGTTAELSSAAIRGTLAEIRGHTNFLAPAGVKEAAYRTLAEHAVAGRLTVEVERVALRDVADAWARQQAGLHGRKLVLVP